MGIIGISGYARSGKDTVADILVAKYGYTKISFADKLREALYALNPIVSTGDQMIYDHEPKYARLRYVINIYGWDGYKESNWAYEIRQLLQRFGTEVGREILGEDVWVNAIEEELYDNVVIPDCRYPNEAARGRGRPDPVRRSVSRAPARRRRVARQRPRGRLR